MTTLPAEITAGADVAPIVPRTIAEVEQFSDKLIEAGMVPDGLKGRTEKETRAKVTLAVVKGLEVGFPPLTAVANIMVVNNRASVFGDALPALVQRGGKLTYMKEWFTGEPGKDNRAAHCELGRAGVETLTVRSFSLADAKRAKLYPNKGPWLSYPDRMSQMRARAWAFRDLFADCLMGLSVAEEAQDLPMRDVTPNASAALDDEPVTAEPVADPTPVVENDALEPEPPPEPEITAPPTRPTFADKFDADVFDLAERAAKHGMVSLETWFRAQSNELKKSIKPSLPYLKHLADRVDNGEIIEDGTE